MFYPMCGRFNHLTRPDTVHGSTWTIYYVQVIFNHCELALSIVSHILKISYFIITLILTRRSTYRLRLNDSDFNALYILLNAL